MPGCHCAMYKRPRPPRTRGPAEDVQVAGARQAAIVERHGDGASRADGHQRLELIGRDTGGVAPSPSLGAA